MAIREAARPVRRRRGGRNSGPAPLIPTLGVSSSLFADASNFDQRFVEDYEKIETTVNALRTLGFKVVLTSGSFDIIHEGHSMYLEAARQFGDFLIVGLDSDEKIRARKGENRPVVPQMERLRMVTHQRGVGLVTLKQTSHPRWALIKAVRPDVLVATEETYTPAADPRAGGRLLRPGRGAGADGHREHVGAAARGHPARGGRPGVAGGRRHVRPGQVRRRQVRQREVPRQARQRARQADPGRPAPDLIGAP